MGNIQASLTKQTLADYTSYMNNAITNIINQANLDCGSGNNITINLGGPDCPPPYPIFTNSTINVDQISTAGCNLQNVNLNQVTGNFQNFVKTQTQQFIQNNQQNKQGWLAAAFSLQISGAENAEDVSTLISNTFDTNITNTCQATVDAYNSGTINLCGVYDGDTFNFNQDALVTALVSCINKNIISVFTSNQTLQNFWQQTDTYLASRQSGIGSILVWIIVAIALVVGGIIIIAIIFIILGRSKKSPPETTAPGLTAPGITTPGVMSRPGITTPGITTPGVVPNVTR